MSKTLWDDLCDWVLTEFINWGSGNRLDSKEAPFGRVLVADFTFWTATSRFLTVRLPLAPVDVACSPRFVVVLALAAILVSGCLPAG